MRASYRSNHRRDIRRLARAGFEPFQQDSGWADVFYELYLQTMQRRNADSFYFFSREMFHRLEEIPCNYLRLIGCRRAGEVICAALITRGARIANYFLGGTGVEYREQAPSKLMFDQAFASVFWSRLHHYGTPCHSDMAVRDLRMAVLYL